MTFTALDFETANGNRNSICQVGLVHFEKGILVKELSILVQPPQNFYWRNFTMIHGISPYTTVNSPSFDMVWDEIKPYIENHLVVAHNGFSFDFPVLQHTLSFYGLETPQYQKFCTLRYYKKGLATLCERFGIPLNHHDALSDAKACAQLFMMSQNQSNGKGIYF